MESDQEEEKEVDADAPDKRLMPEFVFGLDAPDAFLKDRIMALPEAEVAGTENAETAFVQRLQTYRSNNTEDSTVLNYFDFHEVHPINIGKSSRAENLTTAYKRSHSFPSFLSGCQSCADVADHDDAMVFRLMQDDIGVPHNYGLTPEEKAEVARLEAAAKVWWDSFLISGFPKHREDYVSSSTPHV